MQVRVLAVPVDHGEENFALPALHGGFDGSSRVLLIGPKASVIDWLSGLSNAARRGRLIARIVEVVVHATAGHDPAGGTQREALAPA
jgi:hypothetical protein